MNAIIRKLFDVASPWRNKLLALSGKADYAFVINNADRLRAVVQDALAEELAQIRFAPPSVTEVEFRMPRSCLFTYDSGAKGQTVMKKNVYENYLSAAEPRSALEHRLEKFCEREKNVEWIYRNGEKGSEYLSIVYQDGTGRQKLLFPDYVVCVKGEIWILETKAGFERGAIRVKSSAAEEKAAVLEGYLAQYGCKGGIIRWEEEQDMLYLSASTGEALPLEEVFA